MAGPRAPQHAAGWLAVAADHIRDSGFGVDVLSSTSSKLWPYMLPFALYFKPLVVLTALTWYAPSPPLSPNTNSHHHHKLPCGSDVSIAATCRLIWRAYQVLNKPLDDLAGLLGFDIPSAPEIDLAGVKADGAIVHWSLPEPPLRMNKSTHKFEVMVNGDLIASLSVRESAALITGLQPGCYYVVRISLANNQDFTSKSLPLRFRTKQLASGDFFTTSLDDDSDYDLPQVPIQAVPYRGLHGITFARPDAPPPITRENSGAGGPTRSLKGRRASPSALDLQQLDPPADHVEPPEGAETITRLTERLDEIRRETDEAERQAREEEEEDSRLKEELIKERDELKAEALERDKASRNLKKEVNTLERQNTIAQNDRTKAERLLQQKKQERVKMKEDMARWDRETANMKEEVENIRKEKEEFLRKSEQEKKELRAKQAEQAAALKLLDDEVKEKSTEIKKLERSMKNNSPNTTEQEPNLVQQHQQEMEEQRAWDQHIQQLQHQYAITVQKLETSKRMHAEQAAYLEQLRAKRRQEEAAHLYASPPATQERPLRRGDSNRSRRGQSGVSASDSPRMATFQPTSAAFPPGTAATASIFPGASTFFNINNGMTLQGPSNGMTVSDEERERLTGGALMSPGAGANLIPADLFGEGDKTLTEMILPGLGALPGVPEPASTVPPSSASQNHAASFDPGPASPASVGSGPTSLFASPRASAQNLVGSPEGVERVMDSDRRSIRSTRSNRAISGTGSRFSGMFGIKQRAKTSGGEEGLALSKSNSMPRQDGGLAGIDSETRKRNSSISGSMLSGPSFGGDVAFDTPPLPASSRRSRAFGLFTKSNTDSGGGWPSTFTGFGRRPTSPRPGSTHSNELPRPSFDSSRWGGDGWGPGDVGGGNRSSPLAFGTTWGPNQPPQPRIFGSRHTSRRPSAQYGVSGPPDDITEDEDDDRFDDGRASALGPIGSKPRTKAPTVAEPHDEDVPRLNPAAKDFKSFFSSMKLSKSRGEGSSNAGSAHNTPNLAQGENEEEFSPANSRKSRDTRSITTAESSLAESGRNSPDLIRTSSYTSEAAPSPLLGGSSVASRESFMQKISRKSSSGGFGLPLFQRNKSKLDTHLQTTEDGQPQQLQLQLPQPHDGTGSLSASVSSVRDGNKDAATAAGSGGGTGSTPGRESKEQARGSGRNWSNVLKLGGGKDRRGEKKGGGNESPSLSGMSMTTDEDRDEREKDEV